MLSVRISPRRGVLDTTLYDKDCQWLATGRWFSPDNPVSSTNKTDRHDITEILLKVALNTIKQTEIFSTWCSTTLHQPYLNGNEYKISTHSETIKVFNNIYAFVSIGNARLLTSFYVTNNPLRLNMTLLFFVWSFTTILFHFVSIDNKDGHHIEGIC